MLPVCVFVLFAAAALRAEPPPRYEIAPGDWLIYEVRARACTPQGAADGPLRRTQVQVWCMSRQAERRLLLVEATDATDGTAGASRGGLLWIDDRGRASYPDESLHDPERVETLVTAFPVLRAAADEEAAWSTEPDAFGRALRCRRLPTPPESANCVEVEWELDDQRGVATARGERWMGRYRFDRGRGLVTHIALRRCNLDGTPLEMSEYRLLERRTRSAAWIARRGEEWERLEAVLRGQRGLCTRPLAENDTLARRLDRIERLWSELRLGLAAEDESPARRVAATFAARTAAWRDEIERAAAARRLWEVRRAPEWELPDPDGGVVRSDALRRRRSIEFFWSARDLASLRSFAALRAIRALVPADELGIICINLDADAEAARRAIRACAPELTHVLAGAPRDGAGIAPLLPAVRSLEADGHVVELLPGWRPDLREILSKWVRPARPLPASGGGS